MADMNTLELFKPAKYGNLAETVVLWGTNPAWHSPAASGMVMTKLRGAGCKTVVIDPRLTPDASKADVWLPIKPGTDAAMVLGWMNYIIDQKLYEKIPGYEDFAEKYTNLAFLVDARDTVKMPPVATDLTPDGALLRASSVFDDCTLENEGYVYYDKERGVTKAFALGPENESTYHPELFGSFDVVLKDGSTIKCKTAFQAYKDRCAEWTLEKTAEVTGCPADQIKEAIEIYCSSAHGGIVLGVATDQQPNSVQVAVGCAALDCMTARLGHWGCPSIPHETDTLGTIMFPAGLFPTPYNFYPDEEKTKRLGYAEHKALGKWQHSHNPTVLSAALTGKPHQPKVWLERSGNKMVTLGNSSSWVDAFPRFDLIVQGFMYPTSFTTEAADVVFPTCEWLENFFIQGRMNYTLIRQPVATLFEAADEAMMWSKIAEAMSDPESDLYDENMAKSFDTEAIGVPVVPPHFKSIEQYYDLMAKSKGFKDFEDAKAQLPAAAYPDDEYYGRNPYDENGYLKVDDDGLYTGFATEARIDALDIVDSPRKLGPYADSLLYVGRHGEEAFPMAPSTVDYNPMPYYYDPEDGVQFGDEYPLLLTEGRLPHNHHGTLRNNPLLRELMPAAELWIHPADAEKYGIANGDWVNIHSPRTDGLDVFRDISTGLDAETITAVDGAPSEFNPGEELTAAGQAVVADGVYAVAAVTKGIAQGTVYAERFWNPEFLEDGSDGRKSWTLQNINVLTKNTGYYNPEIGSYSLRGINVKVSKAERPEGIWYEPTDFEPWLPVPTDTTGGGCSEK